MHIPCILWVQLTIVVVFDGAQQPLKEPLKTQWMMQHNGVKK